MKAKKVLKRLYLGAMIAAVSNLPLLVYGVFTGRLLEETVPAQPAAAVMGAILLSICWLYFNIRPYRDRNHAGLRLVIMRGGRTLGFAAIYGIAVQCLVIMILYPRLLRGNAGAAGWPAGILIGNTVFAAAALLVLLWNGILRMYLTSARLRVRMRILMLLAMWIPVVNLAVLIHAMRLVRAEYDYACYKEAVRSTRAESDLCRTKYPLIMVHGIGFRDLHYFNYWGRIPRELVRYGASVYYGNQEALGTIACNAEDIRKKILEVVEETGCEKVNIIAHSKGGLDARYAISKLGLAPYTASLTTVSTPHHGCRFVDYAIRLPEGLYRLVARCFDRTFSRFWDKNPDFYTATHQFSTASSRAFNESVSDVPGVFYQSYASKMRDCFSDPLLWIPYCLIKPLEGDNDGLVSTESARWGEFRTVFASSGHRGISHGDMIDLKREDYKGFDVVECYVQIVSELAGKGF